MSFHELRLAEPIVRAVSDHGYTSPTPIQSKSIPETLAGRDVLGCAQTGTGKTCAFALPILQRLAGVSEENATPARHGGRGRAPRALVLCPTRELATQIFDSFVGYGKHLPLRHTVVFGGVGQARQVRAMRDGVDVLVATPGRLLDLIGQGHIDLSAVEVLVLDEADRMLDMGFIHDIRKVVRMVPEDRQTLFFSATLSREIRKLADSILRDPVSVETAPEATTVETIAQHVYMVERPNKAELLERLLREDEVERTLVFTRTKHGADKLVKVLRRGGVHADAIHGNKSQNARTRALQGFKAGRTSVLVATDVASRGIDVDEITHVVNFDMPIDAETYVHRIGRTARAGASGVAVSFCDRDDAAVLRSIQRRTKATLTIGEDATDLTFSTQMPSGQAHQGGGTKPKPRRGGNHHTRGRRPKAAGSRAGNRGGRGPSRARRSNG